VISVSGLGKSYGDRVLFEDASFQLNAGERYGLIGANGSGKTTLLQILAGNMEPSEGSVSIPKRLRIGTLKQDHFLYEDRQILAVALMGNPELWDAIEAKEELLAGAHESFDVDRFSELEEIIQLHDGYTAEARAAEILEGLGLPAAVHRNPLRTLSGGFKLRVLLAQVLASNPDVLLLDEPTNHLDILSIHWLETFLAEFPGPVVVISHDHRFLDRVSTHILDVDYDTVTLYHGDYTAFVAGKQEERERREKDIAGREREIAHQQLFVDRFKAKASKARQAQSKMKVIEKKLAGLETLPETSRRYPTFKLTERRPSGRDVLKIDGIKKSYGSNEVLHGVDLLVRRGDRLAIMGPNGIGKSTLLKIVMGDVPADAGEVTWGYETHPGYFAQDHKEQLDDPTMSAQDWLHQFCADRDQGYVRGHLALLLIEKDEVKKRLASLSGGEAARLVFAKIMLENPNVLVLDEPTNHLDLESIESLVEALQKYEGTLILVSHDRWFISQLATRIVDIERGRIIDYQGTYEEYVAKTGADHLDVQQVTLKAKSEKKKKGADGGVQAAASGAGSSGAPSGASTSGAPKGNASTSGAPKSNGGAPADARGAAKPKRVSDYERKQAAQRHAEVTARVERAEARAAELDRLFADPDAYSRISKEEMRALNKEREAIAAELVALMHEWEKGEETLASLG
jgi:ATPase subunit of ABC transporter with duplicated ATPase domains